MAGIPEKVIEDIRLRSDIVQVIESYVPLKRRGNDLWACCPFHQEKSPSFKVSASRQMYHCFGCKKSGNVFTFVMEHENTDFPGAVRLLAKRFGIVIPEVSERTAPDGRPAAPGNSRERLYELLTATAAWYQTQLAELPAADKARLYLQTRNIPAEIVQRFALGFAPDSWDETLQWGLRHTFSRDLMIASGLLVIKEDTTPQRVYDRFRGRLIFPIWDELGRVVGFSARTLDKEAQGAKYVNTPETPVFHKGRLLYGLHLARQSMKTLGFALICEGQFDVIACHRAGMTNAVAPQGTAFTETHALLLKRFTDHITFAFDADPAGEKAALRSIEIAIAANLLPKVVVLPPGDDPDSMFRSKGAEALASVLKGGSDAVEHVLGYARRQFDVNSPDGKSKIADLVLGVVARLPNAVARATYCQRVSHELGLPERVLFDSLNQITRTQRRTAPDGGPAAGTERGGDRPGKGAAPTANTLASPSMLMRAEQMLLDLALHYESLAGTIGQKLDHEQIGTTPVGQALNQVLGMAAQGEWSEAGRELASNRELASAPEIARVLTATEFPPLVLTKDESKEDQEARFQRRLEKAMNDCLRQHQGERRRLEMEAVQLAMKSETDPQKARELMHRFQELIKSRREEAPLTT